ncbi:M23 family metallopeptidase [Kordia sp.]|uniref:M23 family metallopeptidase n=1 Tax=Kordia sp. TaxID=1965332 RepID=UPI003B5C1474
MRSIVFLLFFCVSLSHAQQVQFKKDSILTTKDTLFYSIKNNMLSPMFFIMNPKKGIPKEIQYQQRTLIRACEQLNSFVKVPRNILENDSASVNLNTYFSFKAGYGDPTTVKHNDNYLYLLPYKKKKKLIQGNFGRFSHDHIRSYHAFDFGTKIGDTIYAAREGKVVMTKEDSKKHGRTRKYSSFANYIIIQHNDGTTAAYYHLNFNGVLIENGDMVSRGQAIGISGMTGFTTTPHLHFVVHKTTEKDGNVSVPITFEGYEKKKFRKGKRYKRRKK